MDLLTDPAAPGVGEADAVVLGLRVDELIDGAGGLAAVLGSGTAELIDLDHFGFLRLVVVVFERAEAGAVLGDAEEAGCAGEREYQPLFPPPPVRPPALSTAFTPKANS